MLDWLSGLVGEGAAPILTYALIFIFLLIGFFGVRLFMRRMNDGTYVHGGDGRKQRLAIMDATPVDNRRRLVLVRRDDVEHLVLIGGMNDVVVEQNIEVQKAVSQPPKPAREEKSSPVVKATPVSEEPKKIEKKDTEPDDKLTKEPVAVAEEVPAKELATPMPEPKFIRDTETAEIPGSTGKPIVNAPANRLQKDLANRIEPSTAPVRDTPPSIGTGAAISAVAAPSEFERRAIHRTNEPTEQIDSKFVPEVSLDSIESKDEVEEPPKVEPAVAVPFKDTTSETSAPTAEHNTPNLEEQDEFVPINMVREKDDTAQPANLAPDQEPTSDDVDLEDEMEQLLNKLTSSSRG